MMRGTHVLLVEDDAAIATVIAVALEGEGVRLDPVANIAARDTALMQNRYDAIITDVMLPDGNGLEGLNGLSDASGQLPPVIVLSAQNTLDTAVRASEQGAFDYLPKPFDLDELVEALRAALRRSGGDDQADGGGETPDDMVPGLPIIGRATSMQQVYRTLARVAPTDLSVLILGESGTGKELVARALHNLSKRAKAPLISVNCAAIPETLIESELFGHEKGAFTGASAGRAGLVEAADGGTLFLDEIGELPLEAQARLLRVLQEGEIRRVGSVQSQKVDVRLIAATHRDLKTLAKTGQFREDLYYRLHVIALKLPPLRERGADVVEIAQSFLTRQSERMGRDNMRFAHDAEQAIRHYPWPGNVRELENAIERSVILCEGSDISAELLGIDIELDDLEDGDFTEQSLQQGSSGNHEPTEDLSLEDYFQHFVLEHQDHMTETELARKLGISRKCLWERRQRLGIPRRKSGAATGS